MKKTTILIEKLIRLANGDVLPACSLKGDFNEDDIFNPQKSQEAPEP